MPQHIEYDEGRIRQFMLEKQANEIELAWDLRDAFNSNEELVGPLRQLASFAVDEMDDLRKGSIEGQQLLTGRWQAEVSGPKNKALIKYGTLSNIAQNIPTLAAEECSDVIRLYGEVVEKGALKYQETPTQPTGFVPGPKHPLEKYAHLDTERKGIRGGGDPVWKVGRQRAQGVPASPTVVHEFIHSLRGGISCSVLREPSTVLRLDRAFGLMEAADISGTTTDTIFFFLRYAALFRSQFNQYAIFAGALDDPIYHLLPLATLVAGGHHSLVESALSLTINGQKTGVDYRIGLYRTLMPRNSNHSAGAAVRTLLNLAQSNSRNRLMLVYYRGANRIGGCYLFAKDGSERMHFERLARADTGLLASFRTMDPWPTKQQIENLIQRQ